MSSVIVFLILGVPIGAFQEDSAANKKPGDAAATTKEKPSVKEQIRVIKEEMSSRVARAKSDYEAAKTDEQKEEIKTKFREDQKKILDEMPKKLWAIAESNRKSPEVIEALRVILLSPDKAFVKKATDRLKEDYWSSPALDTIIPSLAQMESGRSLLQEIADKSPRPESAAIAKFILVSATRESLNDEDKDAVAKYIGELEAIAKLAGNVRFGKGTLRDQVKNELFEFKNLAIGCTAPEITGKDSDGKQFKLSDYRGKVVVVDFWASW